MAREIVVNCDLDMTAGERVPASTYTLDLGSGPREVDLCDGHREALLDPLIEVVEQYGSRPLGANGAHKHAAGQPRSRAVLPAGSDPNALGTLLDRARSGQRRGSAPKGEREHACLFCPLDYASTGALRAHCGKQHGFGADDSIGAIYGRVCPLCGAGGYDVLTQHGARTHEIRSIAGLFAAAAAAGDPHGIVAERRSIATNVVEPAIGGAA